MNYENILTRTWKIRWREKVVYGFGLLMMIASALLGVISGGALAFGSIEDVEHSSNLTLVYLGKPVCLFCYFTKRYVDVYQWRLDAQLS